MYNRGAYNRAKYNRPSDKTIWLDLTPMRAAGRLENTLSRIFYVEPNGPMRARALAPQPGITKIFYVEPEPMIAPARLNNEATEKTINLYPETMKSRARMTRVDAVMSMFPDLEKIIGTAEFLKFAANVEFHPEAEIAAEAALEVRPSVTVGNVQARLASAAFLDVLEDDVFKKQIAEVVVDIQPGEILVINRENFTATLDQANVLEKYLGAWFMILPETISIVIEYDGAAAIQAQVEYTELWY